MLVISVIEKIVLDIVSGANRQADAPGIVIAIVIVFSVRCIDRIAVALLRLAGDAQQNLVGDDRDIDCAFEFAIGVIAELCLGIAFILVGRLFRLDRDQAADRILAEQCTLGPLQHFQIVEIV